MKTELALARCMGGRFCNHIPGTCTATNAEYQAAVARTSAIEDGVQYVAITKEAFDFLMGHGPLECRFFGDDHPNRRGRFWWRTVIRETMPALSNPTDAVKPLKEVER